MYPSSSLLLDASANLDDIEEGESLSFTWSCLRTSPLVGPCDGISLDTYKQASKTKSMDIRLIPVPSILSIVTSDEIECRAGTIVITLAVRSSAVFETAYNDVTVVILSKNTPIIQSLVDTNAIANNNAKYKFNTNDKLLVEGVVSIPTNATVTWSISDNVDLNDASILPTNIFMYRTKASTVSLLLKPKSLPEGTRLTITLTCASTSKETSSSITVLTNSPPRAGEFIVDPIDGVEIKDIFSMSSPFWVDDDLPLSYEFLYHFNTNTSGSTNAQILRSRSQLSNAMTYLSANSKSSATVVVIVGNVYDSIDAYTSSSAHVIVHALQLPPEEFNNLMKTEINGVTNRADPYDTDGIAQLTTIINRYNKYRLLKYA